MPMNQIKVMRLELTRTCTWSIYTARGMPYLAPFVSIRVTHPVTQIMLFFVQNFRIVW